MIMNLWGNHSKILLRSGRDHFFEMMKIEALLNQIFVIQMKKKHFRSNEGSGKVLRGQWVAGIQREFILILGHY